MRAAQAFNGIDRVPVEANINGIRVRILGMLSILLSLSLMVGLSLITPFLGIPVGVLLLIFSVAFIVYLSRVDPDGILSEWTQVSVIRSGLRNRVILAEDTEGVDD